MFKHPATPTVNSAARAKLGEGHVVWASQSPSQSLKPLSATFVLPAAFSLT